MFGILAAWNHARAGILLLLVSGSLLPGCTAQSPDGTACVQDHDCNSGYCSGKYCAGATDCKSDSDCDSGWLCKSYTSVLDSVGNYFGGKNHSTVCAATCGHCPANQHCESAAPMSLCKAGSMLTVSAGSGYEATVNEPVTLTATAQSSAEVVSFSWSVGAASPLIGATVTYAFTQVAQVSIGVTVTDSTGNSVTGGTTVDVRVGAGGACTQYQKCRSSLTCQTGVCM